MPNTILLLIILIYEGNFLNRIVYIKQRLGRVYTYLHEIIQQYLAISKLLLPHVIQFSFTSLFAWEFEIPDVVPSFNSMIGPFFRLLQEADVWQC